MLALVQLGVCCSPPPAPGAERCSERCSRRCRVSLSSCSLTLGGLRTDHVPPDLCLSFQGQGYWQEQPQTQDLQPQCCVAFAVSLGTSGASLGQQPQHPAPPPAFLLSRAALLGFGCFPSYFISVQSSFFIFLRGMALTCQLSWGFGPGYPQDAAQG